MLYFRKFKKNEIYINLQNGKNKTLKKMLKNA